MRRLLFVVAGLFVVGCSKFGQSSQSSLPDSARYQGATDIDSTAETLPPRPSPPDSSMLRRDQDTIAVDVDSSMAMPTDPPLVEAPMMQSVAERLQCGTYIDHYVRGQMVGRLWVKKERPRDVDLGGAVVLVRMYDSDDRPRYADAMRVGSGGIFEFHNVPDDSGRFEIHIMDPRVPDGDYTAYSGRTADSAFSDCFMRPRLSRIPVSGTKIEVR